MKSPLLRYFWKLIRATIIALIIIKITTFGWRPTFGKPIVLTNEMRQSAQNMKVTVTTLSETIGIRNYENYDELNKAAGFIVKSFQDMGYAVQEIPYTINGRIFKNIVAGDSQVNSKEPFMIIGAHYDSCFNSGADDNASGVAGLLELARLLKGQNLKTPIQFVAFVNEEPPFFMTQNMGSLVFAKTLKKNGVALKAVIVLEMLGYYSDKWNSQRYLPLLGLFYPNRGNFIAVIGNFPSRAIVSEVTKNFKVSSKFPIESLIAPGSIPGINFSDHWSFWQEGYPAIMVTDTAFLRNKQYHTSSDIAATLDYERMAVVVHGLKQAIQNLALDGRM